MRLRDLNELRSDIYLTENRNIDIAVKYGNAFSTSKHTNPTDFAGQLVMD